MATIEREPVRAPELNGAAWLNTDHPLTLADLKGKLVLLDFWTYCCINCMHVLPDLKYLEEKYAGQPLVVIGVHSAKFENEQDIDNIRNAILRYGITHPVVVDVNHRLWNAYAVRGWPTVVLVDPSGYLLGSVSGEGHREQLDTVIDAALNAYSVAGMLNETPLPVHLESDTIIDTPLSYPGKVLADEASKRLFISDSGHHRVVIATPDGALLETIGTGTAGADDGSFEEATFHNPQGLALDAEHDWLYVADTDNHLLRRLDLKARTVSTVAGTGEQGIGPNLTAPAREQPLNSPWDVCFVDDLLYIAHIPGRVERLLARRSRQIRPNSLFACARHGADGARLQVQPPQQVIVGVGHVEPIVFSIQRQPLRIVERRLLEGTIISARRAGANRLQQRAIRRGDNDAMMPAVADKEALARLVGQHLTRIGQRRIDDRVAFQVDGQRCLVEHSGHRIGVQRRVNHGI